MAAGPRVILVDTSAWADLFNDTDTPAARRLDEALGDEEDLAIVPIILTEVLQGIRSDRGFEAARVLLRDLPVLDLEPDGHVEAARLFRRMRRSGATVRGAVDCVIAQAAIAHGAELLTADRDFAAIARHSLLRLSLPARS